MSKRVMFAGLISRLEATLLGGPGEASVEVRTAAAQGTGTGALGDYGRQVRAAAYRVTPEQLAQLQGSHSDDVLFEVTVSAAWGAARDRYEAGAKDLDAAWAETEP